MITFVFEKISSSVPMLLVKLFAHVRKRSNSRSEMLFKAGVLKNFVILTGKPLCWSLFLIKFHGWRPAFYLKRDSNTVVFLWILRNFSERLFYSRPVHHTFRKFYLMIDDWYFRVLLYYCKLCFYRDL